MSEPITVWLTPPGPNPWKVVLILEELGVPYTIHSFKFDDVKKPPFINVNPNGRVPAIVDPNTNLTLWESGAIIQYLEETSGQGPYYGQCGWFNVLHPEKIPSAIERYKNEIYRILGVLNTVLDGKDWLVGDKCTFADLSFLPWNARLDAVLLTPPGKDPMEAFPNVKAWHQRMLTRDSWKRAMEKRDKLMDEQGLQPNGMPKGITNIKEYEELMERQAAEKAA